MKHLFDEAYRLIMERDPLAKARETREFVSEWQEGTLLMDSSLSSAPASIVDPGRPERPCLVMPKDVPRRKVSTKEGHAALVHAIVHIEFNAINLALDAVYRFRDMPRGYYDDWLRVADEEAYHFQLLRDRLRALGYDYGDFDAHDGLWEMARQTDQDVMVRMALVPRVMEARGLDATPRIVKRLKQIDDAETAAILENVIFRDEIGHVEIGSRWFRYCCEHRGLIADEVFSDLIKTYLKGDIRGPLHDDARRKAGFSERELRLLHAMVK